MDEYTWLAQRFEAERPHLRAVAYRLLGRLDEVDDAVQESWLRLSGSDPSRIANLGAWLMTVVAWVCLDTLRARHARREESLEASVPQAVTGGEREIDPAQEMELADLVGLALLVVLDMLAPAECIAFVLHDIFAVPFGEIAPLVEREVAAARQLAAGCGEEYIFRMQTWPQAEKRSKPFSPPRAPGILMRCSPCSTRMSYSAMTLQAYLQVCQERFMVRWRWPNGLWEVPNGLWEVPRQRNQLW